MKSCTKKYHAFMVSVLYTTETILVLISRLQIDVQMPILYINLVDTLLKTREQIKNWFDNDDEITKPGFFSIKNSMAEIKSHPAAAAVLNELISPLQAKAAEAYGDVAKNVVLPPEVQKAMDRMSVEQTLKQMGKLVSPEFVHKLNSALNKVPTE